MKDFPFLEVFKKYGDRKDKERAGKGKVERRVSSSGPFNVLCSALGDREFGAYLWVNLRVAVSKAIRNVSGKSREGKARLFAGFLCGPVLKEVFNLGAFDSALFGFSRDGGLEGCVYVWNDPIGLPGLLLGSRDGIELPGKRSGGLFLSWSLNPGSLRDLVVGLKSLEGLEGRGVKLLLGIIASAMGIELEKDLARAFSGAFALSVEEGNLALCFGLEGNDVSERILSKVKQRKALMEALGRISGRLGVRAEKGKLQVFIGDGNHSVGLPALRKGEKRKGYVFVPIKDLMPYGWKGIEMVFYKTDFGLRVRGRLL